MAVMFALLIVISAFCFLIVIWTRWAIRFREPWRYIFSPIGALMLFGFAIIFRACYEVVGDL